MGVRCSILNVIFVMNDKNIAIIDYGMGNIGSVFNSLTMLGAKAFISSNAKELKAADAYIFPGVGAFPQAMQNLEKLDLLHFLDEQIQKEQKPFFGICLGMQLLAEDSVEQVFTKGLNWISGHVVALKANDKHSVPHVGWNNLKINENRELFNRISKEPHFYFDHSYRFVCDEPDVVIATCAYGLEVAAALQKGHIFATQFHPEKSQRNGLKLLRNYLNYVNKY